MDISIDDSVIRAMQRLRQAVAACALSAAISAESGDLDTASFNLEKEHKRLFGLLEQIGRSFLASDEVGVYGALLDGSMRDIMPVERIDLWARRFDPGRGGIMQIMETLRMESGFGKKREMPQEMFGAQGAFGAIADGFDDEVPFNMPSIAGERTVSPQVVKNANTARFFDLVDGAYEDLDRLKGFSLEYRTAISMGLSIHEYRDMLKVDKLSDGHSLVFLEREAS